MAQLEKVATIFTLASVGLIAGYSILKPHGRKGLSSNEIVSKRNEIISNPNIRVLYSSMSFFYLQSYNKKPSDLILLKDVLDVAKPKLVAIQMAEEEFLRKYARLFKKPQLKEIIQKVDYLIKTKSEEELASFKELEFEILEKIYLINYCKENNCTIVYGDEPKKYFDDIFEAKKKLKEITQSGKNSIPEHLQSLYEQYDISDLQKPIEEVYESIYKEKREEIYVQKLMDLMQPKFTLIPEAPYKVIVGIADPKNIDGIANQWKNKFLSIYGHQILEDDSVHKKDEQAATTQ